MREGFMLEGYGGLKIGPGGGGGGGGLGDGGSAGIIPVKDDINTGFPDGDALDYG
ncbi:hypothetical protein HOT99_gp314 [Caulobacter phage CcrBL10]|uniref:Uncharacterized protein n=1 Tax=Caulobacter phage CcrBL10 TaxID=2283269 RepID=A0A385E919_9CAUD|nr:hypothetical protein HOT99_gp314 [Caulobacter phage CcrBL10]AXQ68303.1 hypothetical protein CcrBL10_gp099 [Caulobacter phage CcrBL10]